MATSSIFSSGAVVALLFVTAIVCVADWTAVSVPRLALLELVAKPAIPLLLVAVVAVAPGVATSTRIITIAALVLCCAGDVALMLPERQGSSLFLVGLGSFLVAQILFAVGYLRLPHGTLVISGAILVALMAAPAVLVLRAVGRQDKAMVAPVAVYILAIATMAAAAMAAGGVMTSFAWLPIVGGLSFVASDLLLAINRFVRPLPREALLVHVTYHAAIAGLSLGLLVIAS